MPGRVVLLPRRARPFYGRHPWVFPGAISKVENSPRDGDEVELVSHTGNFVAWGLYNSQSKIRVRLYSWDKEKPINKLLLKERLEAAFILRKMLGLTGVGKACRLLFSEADSLSGCTIDQYDRWLTIQISSLGLSQRLDILLELLVELFQPEGIYLRTEKGIGLQEGMEAEDRLVYGKMPEKPIEIMDGDLHIRVNISEGQKTGFYLDQRYNRQIVAGLAKGKKVIDAFCYSGGFGLHAAKAGASEVVSIDSSEAALLLAKENARINQLTQIQYIKADVFDELSRRVQAGEKYGMVVLDPPKFARNRNSVEDALRAYRRLATMGVNLLEKDGVMVFCCCTGLISMDMIEEILAQVSVEEKRGIQILERRGPSPDHPVSVSCFQTHYLKCLICRVY